MKKYYIKYDILYYLIHCTILYTLYYIILYYIKYHIKLDFTHIYIMLGYSTISHCISWIFPFYPTISPSVACRKISPKTALGVARDLGEFMGRSMGNADGKPIAMV